jgi:hypothetical protein
MRVIELLASRIPDDAFHWGYMGGEIMSRAWKKWSALCVYVLMAAGCDTQLEAMEEGMVEEEAAVGPASVELESNTIQVRYRFTNPEGSPVLALMNGFAQRYGVVTATSTAPKGYSARADIAVARGASPLSTELSVEAGAGGEAGVTYTVNGLWSHHSEGRDGYYAVYNFQPVTGVQVRPRSQQPQPTLVDVGECAGAVRFVFGTDETCAVPLDVPVNFGGRQLPVQSNGVLAFFREGSGGTSKLLYSVGGGYSYERNVTWSVGCDEVITVCTAVPPVPPVGAVTGPWDVMGEEPVRERFIPFHAGPEENRRDEYSTANLKAPVSDPAKWWRVKDLVAGDYRAYGRGFIRRGRELTWFQTNTLSPVTVVAGQTTAVSRMVDGQARYPYVMRPAFMEGSVRLTDPYVPANPGSSSSLQGLFFEADVDNNRDGIADFPYFNNYMNNSTPRLSTSLAATSGNAFTYTSFPGAFNSTTGEFSSGYEQPLLNTYDEPLAWLQDYLQLGFWSFGPKTILRPTDADYDPVKLRYGWLRLWQRHTRQPLVPGQRRRLDHEYCFNEVQLQYTSPEASFYNPHVSVSGGFKGTDWRKLAVDYTASGKSYGVPAVWGVPEAEARGYAQQSGSIRFALPQGSYTLTPGARLVNADGTTNDATFQPISLTVGCGQRVKLVPPLTVVLNPQPECAAGPQAEMTGRVRSSPAEVDRVWYQVEGGPEVEVCRNCGVDPSFAFTVPLRACGNTVKVYAYTAGMPEAATGQQQLIWDDPADGPSCPGTTCVNKPPVARCGNAQVSADIACRGHASVDAGSYDPEGERLECEQTPGGPYALGRQRVTLTCRDAQGLTASCEAAVTVVDERAPELVCPAREVVECVEGQGVASYAPVASDACSGASITCTPASGTSFPLGSTGVACTAVDAAGNRASCAFPVQVVDTRAPSVSCPPPMTAECTGEGGTRVVLGNATASDTCTEAAVSGPSEGTYPVGETQVRYTARDNSGNEAQCTTTVMVLDRAAPEVTVRGLEGSWPPNHQYRTVSLEECGIKVRDVCAGTQVGVESAFITCVTSDEAEDGPGDGHTGADVVLVDERTVKLRAERSGTGDGRVYRIHFRVRDAAGNETAAVCNAAVPHDRRGGAPGVDNGEAWRVCQSGEG